MQIEKRIRQLCLTKNLTYLDTIQQQNNKIVATICDNETNQIYIFCFIELQYSKDIIKISRQLHIYKVINNIISDKLLECQKSTDFVFIKKEYVSGISLKQLLQQKYISVTEIFCLLFCVLNQLQLIYQKYKIFHCNIKQENIILTDQQYIDKCLKENKSCYKYILICFNNAQETIYDGQKFYDRIGKLTLQSPEMQKNKGYNSKTDIWSLGQICNEIIKNTDWIQETLQLILKDQSIKKQYDILKYIVQNMLQVDETLRWDTEQCLKYMSQSIINNNQELLKNYFIFSQKNAIQQTIM